MSKGTLAPTRCREHPSGRVGAYPARRPRGRWRSALRSPRRAQGKVRAPGDRFEMPTAQFVNDWQQPLFAGHFDCWVAVGKPAQCVVPLVVGCEHRVPGPCDGGVDAHPGRQLVVSGLCPRIRRSLARGWPRWAARCRRIAPERKAESALIGWPFQAENVHAKNIRRWQESGGYAAATDKPLILPDVLVGGRRAFGRRLSRSWRLSSCAG